MTYLPEEIPPVAPPPPREPLRPLDWVFLAILGAITIGFWLMVAAILLP